MKTDRQTLKLTPAPDAEHWLETVRQQVNSLRFGVVQIVVHDSRITQIDRTERFRLHPPPDLTLTTPPDPWREKPIPRELTRPLEADDVSPNNPHENYR